MKPTPHPKKGGLKPPESPSEIGLKAFRGNDFSAAISAWESLPEDPKLREALAEAYLRRGVSAQDGVGAIQDLERAARLSPTDPRPVYHLGLARHRNGELEPALTAYARASELGFPRRAALAFCRALAELERNPQGGLAVREGLELDVLTALHPVIALLENRPVLVTQAPLASGSHKGLPNTPTAHTLWKGLGELAAGDAGQARQTLGAIAPMALPDAAEAVRVLHLGQAHVRSGQTETALKLWAAAHNRLRTPALAEAMAGGLLARIRTALEAGRLQEAADLAAQGLKTSPDLSVLHTAKAVACHRLARAAEVRKAWGEAERHWLAVLKFSVGQGSTSMLSAVHQNLALVQEMKLDGGMAARHWLAFQKLLPKRESRSVQPGLGLAERRSWLHRRIASDFEKAGLQEEAVASIKKALKAEPEDLELRLGLAETLVELDRITSAHKEIDAILRIDPKHIEARLLRANILRAEDAEKAAERVLRDILATDPACAKARTTLADLLTDFGDEALHDQRLPLAHKYLAEAHRLDSENLDALAYLAAAEKLMGDPFAYQAHLEELLARGTDSAYAKAFELHSRSLDKEGARRIVARVEKEGKASSSFWFLAADLCQMSARASRPTPKLVRPKAKKAAVPSDSWKDFADELMRKIRPSELDPERFLGCVQHWILVDPPIAVAYAKLLVEGHPDSFPTLFLLAHAQSENGEMGAARESLRKAEKLARKEGDARAVEDIRDMIDMLANPLAGLFQPKPLASHLDDGIPF